LKEGYYIKTYIVTKKHNQEEFLFEKTIVKMGERRRIYK